jgi:cobalt-zinc-cadmium efflux system protein
MMPAVARTRLRAATAGLGILSVSMIGLRHDHAHGAPGGGAGNRRALAIALALIASFTVVEVVGGLLTDSLALLADAAHMLSDNVALALALFAAWLATRPPTPDKTYGYKRAEILAALANGVTLVAVSIWIFIEAARRFRDPPEVLGGWMLAVAVAGLLANIAAGAVLSRARGSSLNVEAAYRHVLADVLGSLGVVVAAIVIVTTGWLTADPLISVVIGALILASAWSILRDSMRILLEATPEGIDATEVGRRMAGVSGVVEVHDLHVWTIGSGFAALSAHVLVRPGDDCHRRRHELEELLAVEFGIEHTTLQVDHAHERELVQLSSSVVRRRTP